MYHIADMLHNFVLRDADQSHDPLQGVNVVEFKLKTDDVIVGVIVEDDCALHVQATTGTERQVSMSE